MSEVDLTSPYAIIAQDFMKRKGYPTIVPVAVEELIGQPCEYYYYLLPEGKLELEVSWNAHEGTWDTLVTLFTLTQ